MGDAPAELVVGVEKAQVVGVVTLGVKALVVAHWAAHEASDH